MRQKGILDVLFHCLTIKSFFIPFKAPLSTEIKTPDLFLGKLMSNEEKRIKHHQWIAQGKAQS